MNGLEERMRARVILLRDQREKFISEAQRNLAALDAAIAEIEALLNPPAEQNGMADEPVPAPDSAPVMG